MVPAQEEMSGLRQAPDAPDTLPAFEPIPQMVEQPESVPRQDILWSTAMRAMHLICRKKFQLNLVRMWTQAWILTQSMIVQTEETDQGH